MACLTHCLTAKSTKRQDALATRVMAIAFAYGGNAFQKMMEREDVKTLFTKGILVYEDTKVYPSIDEIFGLEGI